MLDWAEWKAFLSKHALTRTQAVTTPWEGIVLGNADMGAVVFGPAHRLCFRLTKLDLWDARMNMENYWHPQPLSEFKRFIFEQSKKLGPGEVVPTELNGSWDPPEKLYPCMRTAADLLVRVSQCQGLPIPMTQRLQYEDGLLAVDYTIGWWQVRPTIALRAFVSWQHNVLAMRFHFPEYTHNRTVISLFRDPYGGRSWELLSEGPSLCGDGRGTIKRDPREGMLPPSELNVDGSCATLWQVIPGDDHCPERGFAVVATCAEGAPFFIEPSGMAAVETLDRSDLTLFVALASEFEAPNSVDRARTLSAEAAAAGWDALYEQHAQAWQRYWMQSRVDVADEACERDWLAASYKLAITARSGRPAPCLYGVGVPYDGAPWRGDRHNNFPEYSSLFWGAFAANHAEQSLNYTEFVKAYLPDARRIAREVYECGAGAAFPHCYIDGTDVYWFHQTWARSLFLTAIHAQNCWWHYQYFGDQAFLREQAYPVMRECATFYVELLKKNSPGDYTFWPTIATEIRGWTKDFELNKNCIEDLAHIKFLMRAGIEAATILGVDQPEREAWQGILDHLPAYPTVAVDGKEEFVDFAGQRERPRYNHTVPLAPLWPAEDPDVVHDPALRRIALNTLYVYPWDKTRLTIACMRLGEHRRVWADLLDRAPGPQAAGGFASSVHGLLLLGEMLLTSWDGVVRVFPCWLLDRRARFADLRTKGAFLVSACCEEGRVRSLSVLSERGHPLRIASPWTRTVVQDASTGKEVRTQFADGVLTMETKPGTRYEFAEGA